MHKYYDPRLFHVMDVAELKEHYAPKEVGGVVLHPKDAMALTPTERQASAVDVTRPEHFIAAGFDVNFVGPDEELPLKPAGTGGGDAEGGGCVGGDEGGEVARLVRQVVSKNKKRYVDKDDAYLKVHRSSQEFLDFKRTLRELAPEVDGHSFHESPFLSVGPER